MGLASNLACMAAASRPGTRVPRMHAHVSLDSRGSLDEHVFRTTATLEARNKQLMRVVLSRSYTYIPASYLHRESGSIVFTELLPSALLWFIVPKPL